MSNSQGLIKPTPEQSDKSRVGAFLEACGAELNLASLIIVAVAVASGLIFGQIIVGLVVGLVVASFTFFVRVVYDVYLVDQMTH